MKYINLPPERALAENIIDDVGLFLADGGIVHILHHGNADIWLNQNKNNGEISYRFDNAVLSFHESIGQGIVPRGCLNEETKKITFSGKSRVIEFIEQIGLSHEAADYIVEWNKENSILINDQEEAEPE